MDAKAEHLGGSRTITSLRRSSSGAAAVEFALVAPMLVLILLGIICYGSYFWMSHAVQQVANDAARVSIGGLTTTERASLAQGVLSSEMNDYAFLDPRAATVSLTDQNQTITVAISYDASGTPFWSLHKLLPMPSSTIVRSATVQLGGY